MAKIEASRTSSEALAELKAGRPRIDAAHELAAIRAGDPGDDWADYVAWPAA